MSQEFKDHIVQHPNRYKQTTVAPGVVELTPTWVENPSEVVQAGTPVDRQLFQGITSQLAEKAQFTDLNFTDISQPSSKVGHKVLFKLSESEYNVISRKPSKSGFTFMKLRKDTGVAADANNYGANYGLVRLTGVFNVTKALIYNQPTSYTTSQLFAAGSNDFASANFNTDYGLPYPAKFVSNNGKNIANAWVEFTVNIKRAHNGILFLGFLGTSGSCKNLDVLINGAVVRTIDISDATKVKIIPIPVANYFGDVTVRLQLPASPTGTSVHFLGYNVVDLADAADGLVYNSALYTVSGDHYISQSTGANDYAIKENGGKWLGSFHGGETSTGLSILVDGVECVGLPVGSFVVGKKVEVIQSTNLIDKINTQSLTRIYFDSTFEFDCGFDVLTSFDVSDFYNTMTCSNTGFENVVYPRKISTTTLNADYELPNVLKIVQQNPATKQQITSMYTPGVGYKGGAPLKVTRASNYNKVYHGQVVKSSAPIGDINFSAIKVFD